MTSKLLNSSDLENLYGIKVQHAMAAVLEQWINGAKSGYSLLRTRPGSRDDRRGHDLFLVSPEDEVISLDITLKPASKKNGWNVVHVRKNMFTTSSREVVFIDNRQNRMAVMREIGKVLEASKFVTLAKREHLAALVDEAAEVA
jgi:hypothetical protein